MGEQQANYGLVPTPRAKRWYVVDLVLLGGFGVVYAAVFGTASLSEYLDGRSNGGHGFLGLLLFVGLGGLSLLWLLVLLVRMLIAWPQHVRSWRRLVPLYLIAAAGLAGWLALPFTELWRPGYEPFTAGFTRYARENVDLAAVRDWLSTLDADTYDRESIDLHPNGRLTPRWPDTPAWPAAITRLDPHYVEFMKMETGGLKIRLTWGGAPGHWGVEIGPEDMEVPPTLERKAQEFGPPDQRYKVYDTGEYRLPLAPGAYVWHELQ